MNLEDILNTGEDPSDFWNNVLQAVAEDWQLSQCVALQVDGDSVKLFGASQGSNLRSAPAAVRKAIMTHSPQPQVLEENKECWMVLPLEISGSASQISLVAARDGALTETEQRHLCRFVEVAVAAFTAQKKAEVSEKSLDEISRVVDLGLIIGESAHFGEASMKLCNELDTQLKAMRVTLGWRKKGLMELVATNHGGRVRNDTETAGALARAMDEAAEQDCEVGEPKLAGAEINQQHRAFSQSHGNCQIFSLPLRKNGEVHGAVAVEYPADSKAVTQERVDALRVVLDLVSPQLVTLYEKSGWIGARAWRSVRKLFASLLGYRHTGWKLAGLVLVLGFLLCCVIPITYKVKAPFILRTEASADLTAPFSGYIDTVEVNVGDVVQKGQLLVTLDKRELVMQQIELRAERDRSLSEARRYEAEGDLSQMKLSMLAIEQADAKLEVIDYRLARTQIRAPFDGVIVEGDLKERLSSPTQVGEILMRIVQISDLYGELQVDERDIHFLQQDMKGEIAFTSRPEDRFDVLLNAYEPVAVVKETGTDFRVRVSVTDTPEGWWRPGMSGVCKVDVEKRSIAWIYLHRTWNFLRLKLWF
ncbi:efflux RND transporter periplasmic adaptor subunit [Verrucomicrobiaceae bacterium N1E253]|uniref:Efflux RND transporter periplasmic adaptor subunit n=1 Tax=Oceaniferula marina TaxID=2748318 RepID=A0A851GM53_9BACT|nr:efflux RND transporter periplasmic adaptor subunit [Oceaniferula marina]NWK55880.1 efflux RND transporter periplasmic adaptor subunit [Oceaniferula marina]